MAVARSPATPQAVWLSPVHPSDAGQNDTPPRSEQRERTTAADSAAGARDQRDFLILVHTRVYPLISPYVPHTRRPPGDPYT